MYVHYVYVYLVYVYLVYVNPVYVYLVYVYLVYVNPVYVLLVYRTSIAPMIFVQFALFLLLVSTMQSLCSVTMVCPICRHPIAVPSRKRGLSEHFAKVHPEIVNRMAQCGGMAAKPIVQHIYEGSIEPTPNAGFVINQKTEPISHNAIKSSVVDVPMASPVPNQQHVDSDFPSSQIHCVFCGKSFVGLGYRVIGMHYSECFIRAMNPPH